MKLSFKKEPRETGLAAVARPWQRTTIKGDGKEVGYISPPSRFPEEPKWSVRLIVKGEPVWKWVRLKARFDDEPAARAFLKKNWATILTMYALHQLED